MELVGKEPGKIFGTLHYFLNGRPASNGGNTQLDHPENAFHVYAADWTPDAIDLSIDGRVYHHFPVDQATNDGINPFRRPQYLLLNLALGGSWGGAIDDSILPQRLTVDYVRVYQKSPAAP
jgi:beta-glucanase (GH16 family)